MIIQLNLVPSLECQFPFEQCNKWIPFRPSDAYFKRKLSLLSKSIYDLVARSPRWRLTGRQVTGWQLISATSVSRSFNVFVASLVCGRLPHITHPVIIIISRGWRGVGAGDDRRGRLVCIAAGHYESRQIDTAKIALIDEPPTTVESCVSSTMRQMQNRLYSSCSLVGRRDSSRAK